MPVFVHLIELVGALDPWLLSSFVDTEIKEGIFKTEEVLVICSVDVGRLESLVRHGKFLNPALGILSSHLSFLIHKDWLFVR